MKEFCNWLCRWQWTSLYPQSIIVRCSCTSNTNSDSDSCLTVFKWQWQWLVFSTKISIHCVSPLHVYFITLKNSLMRKKQPVLLNVIKILHLALIPNINLKQLNLNKNDCKQHQLQVLVKAMFLIFLLSRIII